MLKAVVFAIFARTKEADPAGKPFKNSIS